MLGMTDNAFFQQPVREERFAKGAMEIVRRCSRSGGGAGLDFKWLVYAELLE